MAPSTRCKGTERFEFADRHGVRSPILGTRSRSTSRHRCRCRTLWRRWPRTPRRRADQGRRHRHHRRCHIRHRPSGLTGRDAALFEIVGMALYPQGRRPADCDADRTYRWRSPSTTTGSPARPTARATPTLIIEDVPNFTSTWHVGRARSVNGTAGDDYFDGHGGEDSSAAGGRRHLCRRQRRRQGGREPPTRAPTRC